MSTRHAAARPKRAGETFARTHHANEPDGPSSSKKPRFDVRNPSALAPDAPDEDTILELDEIGTKASQLQTKRNAVNLDGYESDSSNEGFDGRADVKAREAAKGGGKQAEKTKDEEENDMFADLEEDFKDGDDDEELSREGKKPKKDVHFLDAQDIEGQVAASKAGGHVSADFSVQGNGIKTSSKPSKPDDDDDLSSADSDVPANASPIDEEVGLAGSKTHAPRLDAFNVRSEMKEGAFDSSGNFVRKAADPNAVHDSWLEGVSKKDMKRAREAQDLRERERREKAVRDDQVLTSDILATLITRLERGETVLEALARLGKSASKKKNKPRWQAKRAQPKDTSASMDVDGSRDHSHDEDPAEIHRREEVETLTGAADQLLTRGQTEIYDASREMLMRWFGRETGEEWIDPERPGGLADEDGGGQEDHGGTEEKWEYRWVDGRDGGTVNGPYGREMMKAWSEAGFFGEEVEFRRVSHDDGEWRAGVVF
ncbi:MAG: hypothetical protein M1817_003691 [Caeruleum heppii]|nr:MAG: hypothetical protein M1817_003691 [Caeruleum heppii]